MRIEPATVRLPRGKVLRTGEKRTDHTEPYGLLIENWIENEEDSLKDILEKQSERQKQEQERKKEIEATQGQDSKRTTVKRYLTN